MRVVFINALAASARKLKQKSILGWARTSVKRVGGGADAEFVDECRCGM